MTDRSRLYDLLTAGTGVIRTVHPELEKAAAARAREARDQVGLVFTGTEADLIQHPTQAEAEARLGPKWTGLGVGELATWNYLYNDPIAAAAEGLLNSPAHRKVLDDPTFLYWGAGIYTELADGDGELSRRWYFLIWFSKKVPPMADAFTDIEKSQFRGDINFLREKGIVAGIPNPDGTFRFEPERAVTRGEMAAFLARIYRKLG